MSKTLAIIGSGWAGYTLSQKVSPALYNIIVISPIRTIQYTPLLASAACGLFNFRLAEEPVRRKTRATVKYYKATAENIDLHNRIVSCKAYSSLPGEDEHRFTVSYDEIAIAPGCAIQTFDTPGAHEHAYFLKTTNDARLIQQRLLEILDMASLPDTTAQQQRDLLNVRIVGGGAVGIEVAAELWDLWQHELRHVYAHLDGALTFTIHEVADALLVGAFDARLSEYAMQSLRRKRVRIATRSHIARVEPDAIVTEEDGRLPYGLLLWATGNGVAPLVDALDVKKPEEGLPRILTDRKLRVLGTDGEPIEGAYALGDAADVEGESLPALAEVALQKADYLVKVLNKKGKREGGGVVMEPQPFEYKQRALLAYLGQRDGIIGGKSEWTGQSAWLAWRSGSLGWTRSWRRKFMILISWAFIWWGGRDIARK